VKDLKHDLTAQFLTETTFNRILEEWNQTEAVYPKDKCAQQIFEEQAARTPDAIAVADDHSRLTYAELNAHANRLARYLVKNGAGEDTITAVFLERSVDLTVTLLAVAKTGSTYLPLDPIYPKARLKLILDDADPGLLLTQASLHEKLPESNARKIFIDVPGAFDKEPEGNLSYGNPRKPLYIIYTSGSTGKPKGVPVTHRSLVNVVNAFTKMMKITPKEVLFTVTTISFDLAELDMYLMLFNGARLVIGSQEAAADMNLLTAKMEEFNATLFQATPVTYKMLMKSNWKGKPDLRVITGGDALPRNLARDMLSRCREVWNCYGPTETAIYSTGKKVTPEDLEGEGYVSIGKALDNNTMFVLDPDMNPVPVGTPGELYIGGDGVSPGYLNLPVMTRERFLPNPYSIEPGAIFYKTGDIVKFLPDGNLIFLNRADSQVKIRGFRIELGEIESILSQFDGISENVVVPRNDASGEKILAAYFVSKGNRPVDQSELRRFLKERLPDYMVPSAFVQMEKFPLTPNNKVDRKALPEPVPDLTAANGTLDLPVTKHESRLAEIWKEIFASSRIGIHTGFFELGGHSLTAAQLITRIRSEFGVDIPFRVIFEKPTIHEIASVIEEKEKTSPSGLQKKRKITAVSREKLIPLSSAQSRIWFMENLESTGSAYNIPLDYRITGELDPELLKQSLQILVDRHESLRTVFPVIDGKPFQEVIPEMQASLGIVRVEKGKNGKEEEILSRYSLKNAQHKFDLETGPLFRFELIVLENGECLFLVNFHHIISDAVSIGIFMDELSVVYRSLKERIPAGLPALPVTYTGFTAWQVEWLESEEIKKQVSFWKKELAGTPQLLQLPIDHPRPKIQTTRGAEIRLQIGKSTRDKLAEISRTNGAGLFVPMLTAYGILLSRYSSQDDFVLGVPFANRPLDEIENLTGVFINNIPIRFTFSENTSFSEAVTMARNKFLAAYENQEVPFERLVDELKVKRTLNTSPLFQALFNFLTVFRNEIDLSGARLHLLNGERRIARYDITLTVNDHEDYLDCVFEYNTDLFRKETVERMAGHYGSILQAITSGNDLPVRGIPLLTENESRLMLEEWNRTAAVYPQDRCIHHLFEEQVKKTPDAIAVVFEEDQLTYAGLNERANQLANYLVGRGAGEDSIVALCLERGLDLITGLLAVSKTGATYLPLDPIYPKARLGLILDDANPVLIVTQASLQEALPENNIPRILVDKKSAWENESNEDLVNGNPRKPAYILYTSGSTGKPKGVQIRHHSVINLVTGMRKLLKTTPTDILLAGTTISFDIAQLEIFLPLFFGARLVIASAETMMDSALLEKKIESSGATLFQATPVTFRMLVLNSWKGKRNLTVLCGGEAMSKELAGDLLSRCREVWNCYGPTETTIWSVARKVGKEDTVGEGYVPIGRPLDNTTLYVLNSRRVPVPAGHPGELYIGGEGVSSGYLNLPEMTAEKFIRDPYSNNPDARIYKTGDLVRYLPDGNLVFLNRLDSQVKIRGFRIELGEIESALSQAGGIRENVVVAREDGSGEKLLVAYYILQDATEIKETDIRQYLKERLPDYMVPSAFVRMDRFPLTANNKIDRKALPEPASVQTGNSRVYVKPVSPTEQQLARIWESLLKIERIGIHDDFFESGGHSMIAVTLMIRIEKEFGMRLPMATLFEHSTIHSLAGILDQKTKPIEWRSLVPIRAQGKKKPLFLVHGLGLNVLLYTTIVNYLDPEQPVYGLQAKGLSGTEEPLETIEEIAAYYISEILTVEPEGPFALAGFSLGGKIAYEMGRQLEAAGKTVSFLGLLDATAEQPSGHMPYPVRILHDLRFAANYVTWNLMSFFRDPDESVFTIAGRKWRGLVKKIRGLDFDPQKTGMVSRGKRSELPKYLRRVHRSNLRASRQYRVGPFNGKVHLFKAGKQTFYIPDPVNYGWDKVARGGVVIHPIPGEHSSTFAPPNDKYFATILQNCLNEHNGKQEQH
jgi:amino acid adenylation domain-containing protein